MTSLSGLIAEEVAEVFPDLITRNAAGEVMTVRYDQLVPLLLNELQAQHQRNLDQDREIEALTFRLAELASR